MINIHNGFNISKAEGVVKYASLLKCHGQILSLVIWGSYLNKKNHKWQTDSKNPQIKSNCVQESTDGKNCQFFISSFGPREHCPGQI